MSERIVKVPAEFAKKARIGSIEKYLALYDRSLSDPDRFWAEQAERITWSKKWDKVSRWDFEALGDISTLADPTVVDTLVKEKKARAGK